MKIIRGVFDWLDVYGTLIGGLLAFIIFLTLQRKVNNKELKKIQFFKLWNGYEI